MAEMIVGVDDGTSRVAHTTLNAVTGNATGVELDCGRAMPLLRFVATATGDLAGTLTVEGSLDNDTWVGVGVEISLPAGGAATMNALDKGFRFYRVSLSAVTGTGTCTCKFMVCG